MPKKSKQQHSVEYHSYEHEYEQKGKELGEAITNWLENFILIPIGMIGFLSFLIVIVKWIINL